MAKASAISAKSARTTRDAGWDEVGFRRVSSVKVPFESRT